MRYGSPHGQIRRRGDGTPRSMAAKYPGTCGRCKLEIKAGDQIMYYPSTRTVECVDCSQPTREALDDEANGACPW